MNKDRLRLLSKLFLTFFKVGLFTFGGGYAMIPLVHREVVEAHSWITDEEMMDMIVIAESTPGPVVINTATFVGYRIAGFLGSFFSTLGVVLPSVVIILIVSMFYNAFRTNKWVDCAFRGISAGVSVLLINNVLKLSKRFKDNKYVFLISIAAFCLMTFFNVKAIFIIIAGIIIGVIGCFFNIRPKKEEQQ